MMCTAMAFISTSENNSRRQFYEQLDEYLKSLNVKFQEKAVITLTMNDKIFRCLSNKFIHEFNSRFISWCRTTFVIQIIGLNVLLCDAKSNKSLLIYESRCHINPLVADDLARDHSSFLVF
jgi:hypothetical protein